MNMNLLKSRSSPLSVQTLKNISKCYYATSKSIISELEVEEVPSYEIEPRHSQEELDKIRNKSRLAPHHRNILHGRKPYEQSMEWYHDTVWYKKRLLGKYGIEAVGYSPAVAWPTKEEIEDKIEYERVLNPVPIQDSWKEMEKKKKEEAKAIRDREEEIDKVVANFDKWRVTLDAKIAKKEAALLEAKQKKERMLEEIREQFGFRIDPRDERFQAMVEQKEKEDKKRKKEEKKKKKTEKLMEMLKQTEQNLLAQEKTEKAEAIEKDTEPKTNNDLSDQKDSKKTE